MQKVLIVCILFIGLVAEETFYKEQDWGLGATMRVGTIPYDTSAFNVEDTVISFVPLLFFENEYFFMRGLESGIKLYDTENWGFNLLTRQRYVNLPAEANGINVQNIVQADTNDIGFQAKYTIDKSQSLNLEVMSDLSARPYLNMQYNYTGETTSLDYKLYAKLQMNSSEFNTRYYGFDMENVNTDLSPSVGVSAKYHVLSNFYLIGRAQTTLLGSQAQKSSFVDKTIENELYLGLGFFNDKSKQKKEKLGISPYIRVAHGWVTPSNIGDILDFKAEKDPYNNQMSSLFFGYPLTDSLFTLPIDVYVTPGFAWHHSSSVQSATQEYIMAIKFYYTIPLPWRIRLGAAEGISYVNEVTYTEQTEMDAKGYQSSNLLNYLDFSLDLSLGDIFSDDLNHWWLGYSLHHRSAIFESSSRYGRIKGGLNIQTVYLQWHF